ncbi:PrgI family protein [Candidatus Gottesmanbacteria bacterium]|nr:PrgI family protein [Candidatus Gottesmanbacteria bacterium]
MEQHPVPRNISGFQFHLVGDMTLRQFGYLAAGAFVGYIVYKAAPFPTIISIPLALACGFAGFAFAFLPIQERPLEKWLGAFIKSIMSPTQYTWYKNNLPPEILTRAYSLHAQTVQPQTQSLAHKETNDKLRAYLATVPVPIHESLNAAEKRYIDKTLALFQTGGVVTIPSSLPTPVNFTQDQQVSDKPASLIITPIDNPKPEKVEEVTAKKIIDQPLPILQQAPTLPQIFQSNEKKQETKVGPTILQDQLSQMAAEKKDLEKQLQKLQQQLSAVNSSQLAQPTISQTIQNEPTIKVTGVKPIISEVGMLNYQQSPNLIAGVIKDPQRKLLPNIILTIKDKNGLPVRALKTNKLGQFTTATPLPNGGYLLEVEDPMKRYIFDVSQIVLSGKVFLPIEIIAKGEKELMREKLTKELFGSSTM